MLAYCLSNIQKIKQKRFTFSENLSSVSFILSPECSFQVFTFYKLFSGGLTENYGGLRL